VRLLAVKSPFLQELHDLHVPTEIEIRSSHPIRCLCLEYRANGPIPHAENAPMEPHAALPSIQKILLMLGFMGDGVTRPAKFGALGQPRSNSQFTNLDSAKPERSRI
jgi:hypothetical protein